MQKRGTERTRTRRSSPLIFLLLILGLSVLIFVGRDTDRRVIRYGEFKQLLLAPGVTFEGVKIGRGEITGMVVTSDPVTGATPAEGEETPPERFQQRVPFRTPRGGLERDDRLIVLLDEAGIAYQAEQDDTFVQMLLSVFTFLLLGVAMIVVLMLIFRWMSGGGGGSPFGFGRGKHRLYIEKDTRTTFVDVAGIDEAVDELREVVDFLRTPERYQSLGGRIPKGVLLVGPPGTGKTLLARAVAGEAHVPFFSMSGSDFVELFAGVGASRVRDLFRDAAARAPCIVFIDELDALGKSRTGNSFSSHEEREQTLNALLVEMDGFDARAGIIIMGATNRPEVLDQALLRPGRFDRTVVVDRPDIEGREAILKVHSRNVKLDDSVDLRRVAALTPGSVGADLENLINEAALLAARRGKSTVTSKELDEAIERSIVGLERRSRIIRPEEKRRVAVHESGHALVACSVPTSDPVHKVSIIPRGVGVGGYVLQRPENDRMLLTQSELEGNIQVLLGGTLAEELTYGEISTGASNDLMRANQIAQRMVSEFGMSRLGRIYHRQPEQLAFLGGDGAGAPQGMSEETAREIDLEARSIVERCLSQVRGLLDTHRDTLEKLADRLVDKEVIDGPELYEFLKGFHFPLNPTAERALQEDSPIPPVIPLEEA